MTLSVELTLPLDRFRLEVAFEAGQPVTGIFGASGAGKTSLLEAVAGLRRGAAGRLALDDQLWLDTPAGRFAPPEARDLGYVPQDGLLFPHWSVRRNLLAGGRRALRRGIDPAALLPRVCELLELTPLLERGVAALSGGERRRVALGRALCSGPRLLLLDEPLASLDLPLRRRLLPLLRRLRAELTVPMLLVSHDPSEIQALCDEVVVLREGRVLAQGEPRRVLADPAVFPLALEEGFENVLAGVVAGRRDGTCVVRLGGGVELVARGSGFAVGDELLVGISSSEIVLASRRPEGLSARNILAARVDEIRSLGDWAVVLARLAPELPPLTVEVTQASPVELALEPGGPVYLVIKATACRLYGG